jgi:hypothetical protein
LKKILEKVSFYVKTIKDILEKNGILSKKNIVCAKFFGREDMILDYYK